MSLTPRGFIDLPPHVGDGGFDHAAVHEASSLCYIAHTANGAIDVADLAAGTYLHSVEGLPAVAGALVSERDGLVFSSNRGDNTVGIFSVHGPARVTRVEVGLRPNGLAWDFIRRRLLCAHVGDPQVPGSRSVSLIDVETRTRLVDVPMPGRTRWTVFDPVADVFHVNIVDSPQIVSVDAADPRRLRRVVAIPHAGPHGLDLDIARRRLYCACDAGVLLALDADTGAVQATAALSGEPDVVFCNAALGRVYVAVGAPGTIDAFDAEPLRRAETIVTEPGAHTCAFHPGRSLLGVLLPQTHRMALYADGR